MPSAPPRRAAPGIQRTNRLEHRLRPAREEVHALGTSVVTSVGSTQTVCARDERGGLGVPV